MRLTDDVDVRNNKLVDLCYPTPALHPARSISPTPATIRLQDVVVVVALLFEFDLPKWKDVDCHLDIFCVHSVLVLLSRFCSELLRCHIHMLRHKEHSVSRAPRKNEDPRVLRSSFLLSAVYISHYIHVCACVCVRLNRLNMPKSRVRRLRVPTRRL
jgi:hypothetical protein